LEARGIAPADVTKMQLRVLDEQGTINEGVGFSYPSRGCSRTPMDRPSCASSMHGGKR
jgi:hypothetical protein